MRQYYNNLTIFQTARPITYDLICIEPCKLNARINRGALCAVFAKKIGVSTCTAHRYLKGRLRSATAEEEKPWRHEGISRATWYRRRARQKLCGSNGS